MRTRSYLCLIILIFPFSLFGQSFVRDSATFKGFMQIGNNGSHARIPFHPVWQLSESFTIEAIVRFNNPLNPQGGAIFINTVGPSGFDDWGWGFAALDRRFGFHVCSPQPTQIMANQTDTVSACRWYHLTGVKSGNEIRFYLDGILKATAQFPVGQSVRTSNGPAQFGYHRPPFNNWFDGNIDEFRLWNFARTESQIQSTMNDTLLGNEPGLQAYYKFNEVGQGNAVTIRNYATATGQVLNGNTDSSNPGFPRFSHTEVLSFPPPPIVPIQQTLCSPGGQFNMIVNPPNGFTPTINRFYWYQLNTPDTSRIQNIFQRNYRTPYLSQTDTFYVSAVSNKFCESKKVPVIAKVLPIPPQGTIIPSSYTFCNLSDITFNATNFPNAKYIWWRGYNGTIPILNSDSSSSITIQNLNKTDTIWTQYKSPDGNCLSNKSSVIVIRNITAPPPILSSPSIRVCQGLRGSTFVNGFGNLKIKLFADSQLTQLINEVDINQTLQSPIILSDTAFWVALSLDSNGCISLGRKWTIGVNPLPKTITSLSNDYNICPEKMQKSYHVVGLPGSSFQWFPTGEFENLTGQGTDSIKIDWKGEPKAIKVLETSNFGCQKDTLQFPLFFDGSNPELYSVSTLENDDSKIEIHFNLRNPKNHPSKSFQLWKDGSQLSTFTALETNYIDAAVETNSKIYQYHVQTINRCGTKLQSAILNNIVLTNNAQENDLETFLSWNKYNLNWTGPIEYDVLRKVDGRAQGTIEKLSLIQSETPNELKHKISESLEGTEFCYRIAFKLNGSVESFSNWSCTTKNNELVFPNIITTNGDGKNDVFEIRNLESFPDSELQIFNRWGKEVFRSLNYNNDWSGEEGIYFYRFKNSTVEATGTLTVIFK